MKRSFMAIVVVVLVCVAGGAPASASDGSKPPSLEFLGQAIVPTGTTFAGTTVGGLSSITYDAARGVFYSLSDDPSQFQPGALLHAARRRLRRTPRQRRRRVHRRDDAARARRRCRTRR